MNYQWGGGEVGIMNYELSVGRWGGGNYELWIISGEVGRSGI